MCTGERAIQTKLKLNEDKTEAMVLGKPSVLAGVSIDAIDVAGCQDCVVLKCE